MTKFFGFRGNLEVGLRAESLDRIELTGDVGASGMSRSLSEEERRRLLDNLGETLTRFHIAHWNISDLVDEIVISECLFPVLPLKHRKNDKVIRRKSILTFFYGWFCWFDFLLFLFGILRCTLRFSKHFRLRRRSNR